MSVGADDSITEAEPRRRRRSWSAAEKRRIVAETLEPGSSVSVVARHHDVNANQVFTWRRQLHEGVLGGEEASSGFVPVVVGSENPACATPAEDDRPGGDGTRPEPPAGRMEIALGGGCRVIVDKTVNAAALARVIAVLERR